MRKWLAMIGALALLPVATPARADDGVTGYLRKHAAEHHVPGLAAAVVRDGQVVQTVTLGRDGNDAKITADTPFLLGSVSKPFTALAVLQLVERGQVDLDAPAQRYLPYLTLSDVTVRHLLTHTSGLPPIIDRTDRFDNTPDGLDRAVRGLSTLKSTGRPGGAHRYSDANYAILGALVAAVSGESFGGYLRQHVLDPLNMRHSAATEAEAEAVGLPPGHRTWFGRPYRFEAPFDTSGVPYGYLAASLDDMTRFVAAQLGSGPAEILSPHGIRESHTGYVDTGGGRYGYGWRESSDLVWHAGATPGYFSHVVLDPNEKIGVIVLNNLYNPALDSALAAAAFGVVAILRNEKPGNAEADPVFTYGLLALAVVAVALLVAIARSRRSAHHDPPARSSLRAAAWLLGCGALAAAVVVGVPAAWGAALPQALLWTPDVGWAIVVVAALAVVLGVTRAGFSLIGRTTPGQAASDGRTGNPARGHTRSGAEEEPVRGSRSLPR